MKIHHVVIATVCLASSVYAQQAPDYVLTNGKIITVDDRFSIAQAIAVRGERIVAVGSNQEISRLAGPNTRTINLGGRSVVPGLIDNHIHLLRAAATWEKELRFDGVISRKRAIEMLQARVKSAAPGEWIYTVGGWTGKQFADDPRSFTMAELDQIAPSNPVSLQESYYRITLNSAALRTFGIEAGKPDPPEFVKGSIQRDAAGKPTGIIQGDIPATRPVSAKLPKVPPDQLEASAKKLIDEMNHKGITAVGVPGCDQTVLGFMRKWKAEGKLSMRAFCIEGDAVNTPQDVDRSLQQIASMRATLFQGDEWIDNISWGESVYQPRHDPMFATVSNPPAEDIAIFRRLISAMATAGLPLQVHAELHNTIDVFLDQIEAVNKEHPIKNLRWQFAHLNQVNAEQLARMQKLGMYAAVHPWAMTNAGIMHELFGDGVYDMPPLRTIQNSGVMWGLGSDGTAANQTNPFVTLKFAVTGKAVGGEKVLHQTISREDALIAHTRRNAFFVFQEDNLGALQPGKVADLAVLDRDYLTIPADQIGDIKPILLMVGGHVAFNDMK